MDPIFEDDDEVDKRTEQQGSAGPSLMKGSFRVRSSPNQEVDHSPPKGPDPDEKGPKGVAGKGQILAQIQALIKMKSSKLSKLKVQDVTKAAAAVNKFRPKVSKKTQRRTAKTGKDLTKMIVNAKRGVVVSFTSLFLAAVTELYPSMPRYNVSLAFFSLFLHHSHGSIAVRGENRGPQTAAPVVPPRSAKSFYASYGLVTLLSIFTDLDWLVSNTRPVPLDKANNFNPYKPQGALSKLAGLALGFNILFKLGMVWSITSGSREGFGMLKKFVVKPLKFFLPTLGMPRTLKKDIAKRLIAIGWIELVCALGMLILSFVAMTAMGSHPHFINDSAGIPLTYIMLLKAVSSLFVFGSVLRNTDMGDFFKEFGCLSLGCKSWYKQRKKRLREKRGFSAPKVLVDEDYISSVRGTKLFDMAMGLWVWIGLGHAISFGGGRASKGVRVITGLAVTCQVLSDILVVLLLVVVGWYVRIVDSRRRRRRRMQTVGGDEEGGGDLSTSDEESDASSESSSDEEEDEDDEYGEGGDAEQWVEAGGGGGGEYGGDEYGYYDENGTYRYYDEGAAEQGQEGSGTGYYSAAATYRGQMGQEVVGGEGAGGGRGGGGFLDRAVACTPQEFSQEWDELHVGGEFACRTSNVPLMVEIMEHLAANDFFVIASGIVEEGTMKFFVLGQAQGIRCYIEMSFDTAESVLSVVLKSRSAGFVSAVVKQLRLGALFGDFEESPN